MTWVKPDTAYWNNKFIAYWHDPIDKVLDIIKHEQRAAAYLESFGETMPNQSTWQAADAIASGFERGQVPSYNATIEKNGAVDFAAEPVITHPTSGSGHRLKITGADLHIDEIYPAVREFLDTHIGREAGKGDYAHEFKGKYERFAIARLLYSHLVLRFILSERNVGGLGALWHRLPADSRFPDHSIWQHNALCSAMHSCIELGGSEDQVSLMAFSITPVQGFISKARKLRDYWTGSVLLSWLAFEGIRWVIENLGADHVVYPSLVDQPLVSAYLESEWGVKNQFKPLLWNKHPGHIASFPNKFLFLAPFRYVEDIGDDLKAHINIQWNALAAIARDFLFDTIKPEDSEKDYITAMFNRQIKGFWDLHWAGAVLASKNDRREIEMLLDEKNVQNQFALLNTVEPLLQKKGYNTDRASRGILYSSSHALVQAALAAEKTRKEVRHQEEPGEKCHLCGEFEVLHAVSYASGSASDYANHVKEFWFTINQTWKSDLDFKDNEKLCAVCFVKRAVSRVISREHNHPLNMAFNGAAAFPSTTKMALHSYYRREKVMNDEEKNRIANELHNSPDDRIRKRNLEIRDRYYAILLMDGDHMGRLINGETIASDWQHIMHPSIVERIERPSFDVDYRSIWGKIFAGNGVEKKRLVTPAIHAAISEALGDFAIYGVAPIIEKHEGKLIYAGGDDVCAIMPIGNAVAAAEEILKFYIATFSFIDMEGNTAPVIGEWAPTPGKLAVSLGIGKDISISAGILICHHKENLSQMIMHAHDLLEKKAKKEAGRNACAIEVRKRHGGSRFFVRKWSDRESWDAFKNITRLLSGNDRQLSNSLMHRLEHMRPGIEAFLKYEEEGTALLEKFIAQHIERSEVISRVEHSELAQWITRIVIDHRNEFNPEGLLISGFLAEVE